MADLGRYQLLRRVGMGGMAEVWKAKVQGPAGFEKIVAIKRVLPHLGADLEFIDMFVSEAKLVARLHHPNIVQVFDFGLSEPGENDENQRSDYFIAMEYVPGHNVSEIVRRHAAQDPTFGHDLALFIGKETAKALAYAHTEKGADGQPLEIVHRDISPHNIMVSFRGEVKVTDFGIAKVASALPRTAAGVWKGKISYMSPEQAQLQPLDHRSDVFSLGIVLYELLMGKRLFPGSSSEEIYSRITSFATPGDGDLAELPEPVRRILQRALQVNREERYDSAEQMQADLLEALGTSGAMTARKDMAALMEELFPKEIAAEVQDEQTGDAPTPLPDSDPHARTTIQVADSSEPSISPRHTERLDNTSEPAPAPDSTKAGRTGEWMQAIQDHEDDPGVLTTVDHGEAGEQLGGETRVGAAGDDVAGATATQIASTRISDVPDPRTAGDPGATQIGPADDSEASLSQVPTHIIERQKQPSDVPTERLGKPDDRTDQVRTVSTISDERSLPDEKRRVFVISGGTAAILLVGVFVIVGVALFAGYVLPELIENPAASPTATRVAATSAAPSPTPSAIPSATPFPTQNSAATPAVVGSRATPRPSRRPRATATTRRTPRSTAIPVRTGFVTVRAQPWCEVWIDNERIATETPVRRHEIKEGEHVLRVRNPDYGFQKQLKIKVRPGKELILFVNVENGTVERR